MNSKAKKFFGFLITSLVACGLVWSFTGSNKKLELTIEDGNTLTTLNSKAGMKVSDYLEEAEIVLGENDEISPNLEAIIASDDEKITVKRHALVNLYHDGTVEEIELVGATVSEALSDKNVSLQSYDEINVDKDVYLTDGLEIHVTRKYEVTLDIDGYEMKYVTTSKTVKDFLASEDIKLLETDELSMNLSDVIDRDVTIYLSHMSTETVVEEEIIPYKTETIDSNYLNKGETLVSQEGKNGKKKVTYLVSMVGGVEASRVVLSEQVIKKPVNEIIYVGKKQVIAAGAAKTVVSKIAVDDCDGSGHGFYIIEYSDGSEEYEEY